MKISSKKVIIYGVLIVVVLSGFTGLFLYKGKYVGEEKSPDGAYVLKYYRTWNPFKTYASLPGGPACKPTWVRLYDNSGDKLNEILLSNCKLAMDTRWKSDSVVLGDNDTEWKLTK
jgi:hypothetical protein